MILDEAQRLSIKSQHVTLRISTISLRAAIRAHAGLLVLPALFLGASFAFQAAVGPTWANARYDPDYPYLFNALNFALGLPSGHIDHPGISIDLLGAAVLTAVRYVAFAGSEDALVAGVLHDPERSLALIRGVLMLLISLGLLVVGLAARRAHLGWTGVLACQASPLLMSADAWFALVRVEPEPLIAALGLLLTALVLWNGFQKARSRAWTRTPVAGVLVAAAVAAKVTALPWVVAGLLVGPGLKARLGYAVALGLAAFLLFRTITGQLGVFETWVMALTTHTGPYGTGAANVFDLAMVGGTAALIVSSEPVFAAVLILSLGLYLGLVHAPVGEDDTRARRLRSVLLFGIVAQIGQVALVSKHPFEVRYLLPGLVFTGPLLGADVAAIRLLMQGRSPRLQAQLPKVLSVSMLLLLIPSLSRGGSSLQVWNQRRLDALAWQQFLEKRDDTPCAKVYYGSPSDPQTALAMADHWAGAHYGLLLSEMYPDSFAVTLESGVAYGLGGQTTLDAIVARYPCTVLRSEQLSSITRIPGLTVTPLFEARQQAEYSLQQ
jgi:hypothetical protein